jgi:hypothetical protein
MQILFQGLQNFSNINKAEELGPLEINMKKSWPVRFGFYIRPVKKNCNLDEAHIVIGLSITHDMGFSNLERERNHVV